MWHWLFHRNPYKYPLPMGYDCKGCDRERWKHIHESVAARHTTYAAVRQAMNEYGMR